MTELTDFDAGDLYYEPGEPGWYDDLWAGAGPAYERAFASAFSQGQYTGQQGTVTASEILDLARLAGVTNRTRVLDLCSGPGGPSILLAKTLGCPVIGVDSSPEAVRQAGLRAARAGCRPLPGFRTADALSLPFGRARFDVVFLLETMSAFPDKWELFSEIARVLPYRGRFAATAEVGQLTGEEKSGFPSGNQIFLLPREGFFAELEIAGFRPVFMVDRTAEHAETAARLSREFRRSANVLAKEIGPDGVDEIARGFASWSEMYRSGRVHKLLMVLEKDSHTNWARVM